MSKRRDNDNPLLILLDAHAILHRAYHAMPDFNSRSGEPTGALYGLARMLLSIHDEFDPDYMIACFDLPRPTFRHEEYEDYKSGRKETDDELKVQLKRARDLLDSFGVPHYELEGFEADDLLGTITEELKGEDIDIVIASGDMDTLQLVDDKRVQVYTLRRGIKDTVLYDEEAVRERYDFAPEYLADYKGLRGDPSDNIPGVRGVGKKNATTLITSFGTIEEIYKNLHDNPEKVEEAGVTTRIMNKLKEQEEEARFSKMLATVRLDAPMDFSLPEATWREGMSPQKVVDFLKELDFNSLIDRFKDVFSDDELVQDSLFVEVDEEDIDEDELKRALLALWLVDSSKVNPELQELLSFTGAKDFKTAQERIFSELDAKNLTKVYEYIEEPLIPVVEKMNENGIAVDTDLLADLAKDYHQDLEKLEEEIHDLAETEFNVNSPQQLSGVLFEQMELPTRGIKKTSTGNLSTAESELLKLEDEHDIISKVLDYRGLQKLLSTYIDAIPNYVDDDGRLRATFIQTGTATGRMSSRDPNLQNIPIKSDMGREIRKAFVAPEGKVLAAFDYSQIELRIAAMLSEDRRLLEIFAEGEDIHEAVARDIFDVDKDKEVGPRERNQAKVVNFGILYGMGVNALKKNLDTTKQEAQEFLDNYFSTYTGLAKYLEEVKKQAAKQGYTTTYYGRRRYFPGISSKLAYIKAQAERMAMNAPIQGTQADIIKRAMVEVEEWLQEAGLVNDVLVLLQIHDELVYEIAEDKLDEVAPKIKELMERVLPPEETGGITFVADGKVGKNWFDMEKLSS